MAQNLVKAVFKIGGMTCSNCELRIENSLGKLNGVAKVAANYNSSTVEVTFDDSILKINKITEAIEKLGYKVTSNPRREDSYEDKFSVNQLLGIVIILIALYLVMKNTVGFNFIPTVNQNMGYGILFVVGLITSLHCVAMCGGINLSQCVSYKIDSRHPGKKAGLVPSLLYNSGRVLSYTVIGGLAGALGSAISFSGAAKGSIAVVAGVFMVIMGLNMLNLFPWLRRFNLRMPKGWGQKVYKNDGRYGPFYIGLLNGLMPCGPLQAMQIYALGTGSFAAGAFSMFMFSLGTVPLMFGLGALSSVLTGKFTHKMVRVSAVLVIGLGIVMVSRGLSLSGVAYASPSSTSTAGIAKVGANTQVVTSQLDSGRYPAIVVQKGIPVRWIIEADPSDINGCNETLVIPKLNLEKKLVAGKNIIEFTPTEEGNINYTCWMGMIGSNIKVVPDINNVSSQDVKVPGSAVSRSGGCCATESGF